jgi:hypothetical protein
MIEIDHLYTAINRKKRYEVMILYFFWTALRSDEILEVGGIDCVRIEYNLN